MLHVWYLQCTRTSRGQICKYYITDSDRLQGVQIYNVRGFLYNSATVQCL
jgi:hypothetical protein